MEFIARCLICNQTQFNSYLVVPNRFNFSETFKLVQCQNCQFVFLNPRPDSREMAGYYPSGGYDPHRDPQKVSIYNLIRKWTNQWKRKKIEEIRPQKGTIFDYGCGTGEFLYTMANHSWEVRGIEVNENARDFARSRYHLDVQQSFDSADQYDLVTFWHSLEHIPDPEEVLKKVYHHTNENGGILIAVPNLRSGDAKFYQRNWAALDAPRHLFHFTPTTMSRLLESNGFKVVHRYSMPVDFIYHSLLSEIISVVNSRSRIRKILSPFYFCLAILRSGFQQGKGNASSILYYAIKK